MPFTTGRRQHIRDPRHTGSFRPGPIHAEMPGLTKAQSTSSSSSPSTAGSFRKPSPNRRRGVATQSGTMGRSSDDHIIRGAEILRRQILESAFRDDKEIMYLHRTAAGSQDGPVEDDTEPLETYEDSGNDSEWSDPFPPPKQEIRRTTPQGSSGAAWLSPFQTTTQNRKSPLSSLPAADNAKHWACYVSDASESGDDRGGMHTDDDDTTAILARATQIISHASEVSQSLPARVSPDSNPQLHQEQPQRRALTPGQYLVPRVDEIETSTFDSSTLTTRLLPDLNCAAFVGKACLDASSGLVGLPDQCVPGLAREPSSSAEAATQKNNPVLPNSMDLLKDLQENEEELYRQERRDADHLQQIKQRSIQRLLQPDKNGAVVTKPGLADGPDPCDSIVPPSSEGYRRLMRDPGYLHAQRAGILWQSIVSQHVRFPTAWWNGTRNPPMGVGSLRPWVFLGRHRVRENPFLQYKVRNRGSGGRLLLHVLVRDIMTGEPTLDLAVGCFHPNARGIRTTFAFDPYLEDCRDIWMAIRQRTNEVSVMESMLQHGREPEDSPLGSKHAIDNENLRAVFGEAPPIHTILVSESELYELFSRRLDGTVPPAAILLEEYVAEW